MPTNKPIELLAPERKRLEQFISSGKGSAYYFKHAFD